LRLIGVNFKAGQTAHKLGFCLLVSPGLVSCFLSLLQILEDNPLSFLQGLFLVLFDSKLVGLIKMVHGHDSVPMAGVD
jgi:hypothetical protein